ncbi:transglycosylase domain-containing protein [Shouchella shacheensis]|uniref:transglycosylase domain-containing protein n=1 Tax=Shouchella shacheensis TaxID=1649580 RepID=UPI00073FEE11|nr:transglycosylase domain-containing protein [Shouchella shacheensis]
MKQVLNRVKSVWKAFTAKLEDIRLFHKIGIVYQVAWNLFLLIVIIGFLSLFFIGGTAAGYFASLVNDELEHSEEDMKNQIGSLQQTSELYFNDEVYLGKIRTDLEREEVSLDEISDHLKTALIATEDEHFYEHEGIVPKAILRATMQEFANSTVQTGGSTLTQQLVKQQILSSEVSFERKATEMTLAMRLETFMSKDQILEAYLNVASFGRNASGRNIAGGEAAAQGIFGIPASELNLAQSAYIAGMPQSPYGYTPYTTGGDVKEDLSQGFNRQATVLSRMFTGGFISETEYEEALDYDLTEDFIESSPYPMEEYPILTEEIMRRATQLLVQETQEDDDDYNYEDAQNDLATNGYRVYTTIDKDMYEAMNDAVNTDELFGPNKSEQREEVGSMLIENSSGAILGFVGGRSEGDLDHLFNHATQANRQSGSTMKPLLAYGPAIEAGVTQPGLVIPDTPEWYENDDEITNVDFSHLGNLTVRESLARSRNIPAIRAAREVPQEVKEETRQSLGFTNFEYVVESTPLGPHAITIEQNTSAYSAMGNNGTRVDPYLIDRIEAPNGDIIYEHEQTEHTVFSPQTNYLLVDMLRDVMYSDYGTARGVPSQLDFSADWASKTGTTNEVVDSWFMATNPDVTLSTWIGYSGESQIGIENGVNGLSHGQRTQRIWANIANAAYTVNPNLLTADGDRFSQPDGIVEETICSLTGDSPDEACEEADMVNTDLFATSALDSLEEIASRFSEEIEEEQEEEEEEEESD